MSFVEFLAWAGVCFITLRACQNLIHLGKNIQLFTKIKWSKADGVTLSRHYYLIIPVLREQAVIGDTLRHFAQLSGSNQSFSIIVVTTKRESLDHYANRNRLGSLAKDIWHQSSAAKICDDYAGVFDRNTLEQLSGLDGSLQTIVEQVKDVHDSYVLTNQLALSVAEEINAVTRPGFVKVVEYPKKIGVVAHQINFAIRSIDELRTKDYIGIYNADSRPPVQTLLEVEKLVSAKKTLPPIIQQSSLFMLNVNDVRSEGYSWKANAFLQSLWTLKHEVTMLRLQSRHSGKIGSSSSLLARMWHARFTVCTCHGLFINSDYYRSTPLLEEVTVEDTSYGLLQCLNRVPVMPLYVLENSESPNSLVKAIRQKRTWFRLVFDLSALCRDAMRGKLKVVATKPEICSLALQIIPLYVMWFLHSIVTVLPFIVAIVTFNVTLLVGWLCATVLYWVVPAFIMNANLKTLVGQESLGAWQFTKIIFFGIPGVFSHSVGPWLGVYDGIRKKLGFQVEKKKTER